jgi:uncharacterized protein YdeI (YjbR/CyaY-like superfamily)
MKPVDKPALQSIPTFSFAYAADWESWLAANHADSSGVWLRFFKKGSGIPTVTYPEALDAALCYGWIDGLLKQHDGQSWVRKFTPRRPRSVWSKRSTEHATRLINAGKMRPAGLQEVETAKADGRWRQAHDSQAEMQVPEDFLRALAKNKKAQAAFAALNKANTYAIAWRLQTAKRPETREKRMRELIDMLARGEKPHEVAMRPKSSKGNERTA